MPNNVPFGIGKELIVNVEINPRGIHDIYINNLVGLGLDLPDCDNMKRSERAPSLQLTPSLGAYTRTNLSPTMIWPHATSS